VLILGGGDGLAAREVLRHPRVESITLVDLDPEMTRIFSTHPLLVTLNQGALSSPKLRVVNDDAFVWLDRNADMFDFIIVDFPDPNNYGVGKLYTTAFYRLLARHLSRDGLMSVQATSPLFARKSYWCIAETIGQAGLTTYPYHLYVPSFGEWGFVLATRDGSYTPPTTLPTGLRYLTLAEVPRLFEFSADMQRVAVEPNRLNTQVLVRYYEEEWDRVNR
jgi:spermidine synthase